MQTKTALILLLISCMQTHAQVSNRAEDIIPMRRSSGVVENTAANRGVIYREVIKIDEAASMRLQFGRVTLGATPLGGQPTVLRITSYQDGAVQHLTTETLQQWRYSSAWFNGSMVLVELIADPFAEKSHVELNHVLVELLYGDNRSICGPTDDRVLSDDPKTGRVYPIGCTSWLIDDPNRCLLTAGHCTSGIDVIQFNVPLSDSNGNWQHPGPEDQYMVDASSLQFAYSTIGDDWAYFGCFPNSETGLTAGQAQGEWFTLADSAPPAIGQTIRITGYGSTSSPIDPTWNSAQKTHSGPYVTQSGDAIAYAVDTSGGNSGSAVLNETTGQAIGIHTNAGCGASGGENWGCAIHNNGLQYALANPQGVCIPFAALNFGYPDGLPNSIHPNTVTPLRFTVTEAIEMPIPESVECKIIVNGVLQNLEVIPVDIDTYSVMLPGLDCEDDVGFYISARGDGGTTQTDPLEAPETLHELTIGTLTETVWISANFDAGLPLGWTADGLWHATSSCEPSGDCNGGLFMYFGQEGSCDYDTDETAIGTLETPAINISKSNHVFTLSFCYALETEEYEGYDTARVYANGNLVETLSESAEWVEKSIALSNITGHEVTLTWEFDSVDELYNNYRGLHIDYVRLTSDEVACDDATCLGDINQDNEVDVADLLLVIGAWGNSGEADIDGDGTVNVADLLILIGAWGACE